MPSSPYTLIYDPVMISHLARIERKYHGFIRQNIEEQLRYGPGVATRNRKPYGVSMAFGDAWELRFGLANRFRVFYRINDVVRQVRVLGILVKIGNRLYLGDEEFKT